MSDQDPKCKQSELTINSSQGDLLEIQEVFFPLFPSGFFLSSLVHFYQSRQPSLHPSRADFCSICPDLFPPVNSQTPRWLTGCRTDSKWNGMTPVEREGDAQGPIREEEEEDDDAPNNTTNEEDRNKSQRCVELVRNPWEITAREEKSCNWISLTQLTGSTVRCCVQRQIAIPNLSLEWMSVKYVSAKPHISSNWTFLMLQLLSTSVEVEFSISHVSTLSLSSV